VIVLLYHDVVPKGQLSSSGFSGGDADTYKFEISEFVRHMDAIEFKVGQGAVASTNGDVQSTRKDSVLLTFDDGGAGAITAAELLEKRGWKGHFFVTTNYIGKPGFLSDRQIRDLSARGHIIGSHSCSHPARMSHCSLSQLEREWDESSRILADICGSPIRVASVPGGYFATRVAEAAGEAGITALFNSEPTTRPTQVGNCTVIGRFSIQQGVSTAVAASIASGDWRPRMRQFVYWNAKKFAKRIGGNYYLSLRKSLLNRKSGNAV